MGRLFDRIFGFNEVMRNAEAIAGRTEVSANRTETEVAADRIEAAADKSALSRLRELTRILPPLVQSISVKTHGIIEYMPNSDSANPGKWIGYNVWNQPEIAVQRVFMSKGTEIPEHIHYHSTEWAIVYVGSYLLRYVGTERICSVGDSAVFLPGEPHSGVMLEDTWVLCLTVPADEGYPNDEQ